MLREFFYLWKALRYPRKSWKTLELRTSFFHIWRFDRTRAPTRRPTPDPPHSRAHNTPISSYQLPCAPFPCSRVTLCFRRSGVSGSYIRTAAAGTSSLVSFPPSKVQASFAALRHTCMYNVYTCTCWLSRCRNVLYSLYEYLKFCYDTSRASRARGMHRETLSNEHRCGFFRKRVTICDI